MLGSLNVRPDIRVALRSGPLGPYVDPFVGALAEQGYASSVQRRYVRAAAAFGRWMVRHRIPVRGIDEEVVARFCRECRRWQSKTRARGRVNELATGVRTVAAYLWCHGVAVHRPASPAIATERERWLT
jgi:hypothetical protein